MRPVPIEDCFVPEPNSGCWLWLKETNTKGYGRYRKLMAHRVVYEAHRGPIPEGLTLDHLCRVRSCVNPSHLEPVSMRDNILRGTCRAAVNSRKTECQNGHPLEGENVRITWNGDRECRECRRAYDKARPWRAR